MKQAFREAQKAFDAEHFTEFIGDDDHDVDIEAINGGDGKIIKHTDIFDLWEWSKQALGVSGYLLGWSGFMKNKILFQEKQKFI